MPAPLDIQVTGNDMDSTHQIAADIAQKAKALPGVSDVLVPQDVDYPALQLDIDRLRTAELGLNEKEVVGDVITALTSDQMIAPSYWVDPKSGNDYFLTVQYPEGFVKNLCRSVIHPGARRKFAAPTRLDTVSTISHRTSPTEVDHYQLRREMDVYVSPTGEDLGKVLKGVQKIVGDLNLPSNVRIVVRGSAHAMQVSFPQLRPRFDSGDRAGLFDSRRAVQIVPRSAADFARRADRLDRRFDNSFCHRHHAQRHVADGHCDDGRHRRLEQHSHRRIHQPAARGRPAVARGRFARLPRAFASGADDVACHIDGLIPMA
jgi:hypothetical protein